MKERDKLAELLSNAVSAIAKLASENDLRSDYRVRWFEPTEDSNRFIRRYNHRSEFSFRDLKFGWGTEDLYDQITSDPYVKAFIEFAAQFADQQGQPIVDHEVEGIDLVLRLLDVYFKRAGSLIADDTVINQICTEYVRDLASPTAIVETVFLVENFEAPTEFGLTDEITFRPLTDGDIDHFGRESGYFTDNFAHSLNKNHWICQTERTSDKDTMATFNDHRDTLTRITGALNLAVEGRASFTLLGNYWKSPYLTSGTLAGGEEVFTSGNNGSINMVAKDIEIFQSTYQAIQRIQTEASLKGLQLPLRRLRQAASRSTNEDRLVDYVIGLESLLAADTERLESTFRFRLRGAALLPESFGTPRERMDFMSKLYNLRSRVVHGDSNVAEVNDSLPRAEEVLKTILLWFVKNMDCLGSIKEVDGKLDEALVAGGIDWARDFR